jgi:ferric iron reductase protein FhuF
MSHSAVHTIDVTTVTPIVRVLEAIRQQHGAPAVHGVTRSLVVDDPTGWRTALDIDDLLAAARVRWPAEPHVAAALAWKSYAYGAMLPSVLGYAAASTVPVGDLLVRLHGHDPFVEFGLATPDVIETDPLDVIRSTVFERHLGPVMDDIHRRVRIGRRTLLGSVASGICHALARADDHLPGSAVTSAYAILDALDLADLVDFYPDASGRLTVARRTCCLGFALPTPKICAGCCIPVATS